MKEVLKYIADSPTVEYGGFHPNTVEAAKWALKTIAELEAKLARLVEAAKDVQDGFDEHWESLFPERVKRLKAAIAATNEISIHNATQYKRCRARCRVPLDAGPRGRAAFGRRSGAADGDATG